MVKSLQSRIQNGSDRSLSERTNVAKTGNKKVWCSPYYNCCVHRTTIVAWEKKYGNPEKNYLRMEEKTPQQELAELRAALKAANEENRTLKYVMRIIEEEYGENVVKKYLPGLPTKKPATKKKTK